MVVIRPPALFFSNEIISVRSELPSSSRRHFGSMSQSMRASGKASRSAEAAGRAWITSPSEPRRTRRKRASGIAGGTQAREQIARGMLLGIADDGYADAEQSG